MPLRFLLRFLGRADMHDWAVARLVGKYDLLRHWRRPVPWRHYRALTSYFKQGVVATPTKTY